MTSVAVPSPLDAYFTALDGGDSDGAAAAFTADALYVRPYESKLEVIAGRNRILEFFHRRGEKDYRHEVRACVVDGSRCFAEGVAVVDDEEPTHVFLVHATIEPDGLISRYLALFAATPGGEL
jgi:ketosteroid isomerase-like protein